MIEVKLDRTRKLKFDARALYEAEKMLGTPIFVLLQDSERLTSIEVLSVLLWAGMLHKDDLTFDEVLNIIPMTGFVELLGEVMKEITASIGVQAEKKSIPKKTTRRTGGRT